MVIYEVLRLHDAGVYESLSTPVFYFIEFKARAVCDYLNTTESGMDYVNGPNSEIVSYAMRYKVVKHTVIC